jgi:hypothetical protein
LAAESARIARLRAPPRPYRRPHIDASTSIMSRTRSIVARLTGIGDHDPAARRGRCRLECSTPKRAKPITMLHNHYLGILV